MGWFDGLRQKWEGFALGGRALPDGTRVLDVDGGDNVRELGGYVALGGTTRFGRYLRSGSTEYLSDKGMRQLRAYGVTHVLDLRGSFERPHATCRFSHVKGVEWLNVPLFGYDLSDPKLAQPEGNDDYLVENYLTMLGNHEAIRSIVTFLAEVPPGEAALFHCAAGMDRTGITAMLLLGAVGVGRRQIVADYAYSFGSVAEVDRAVDDPDYDGNSPWNSVQTRISTMRTVYGELQRAYGSVGEYLGACGVTSSALESLRTGFVE